MARVALIGDNSVEYINALIDIWNNGDCAVLIDWKVPFQTAYEMMKEAEVSKCYIENRVFDRINSSSFPLLQFEVYINNTTSAMELPMDL